MLLSIYYFFKQIKPMNNETQHTTLKYLTRRAIPSHFYLVEKCKDEVVLPRGMNFVRKTGLMPAFLSKKLLQKYIIQNGNQGY